MTSAIQTIVARVVETLQEYNELENFEVTSSVRVALDRWRAFKDIPVFRENLELAENKMENLGYFHTIYEMMTGEKIDKETPTERYLDSQTLASAMMINVHPSLLGYPVYKYMLDSNVLSEMYGNVSNNIIYSISALLWAYMYPEDGLDIKVNMGSLKDTK